MAINRKCSNNYYYSDTNHQLGTQQECFRWMNSSFTSSSYSSTQLVNNNFVLANTIGNDFNMRAAGNFLLPKRYFFREFECFFAKNTEIYYNPAHGMNPIEPAQHRKYKAAELMVYNNGVISGTPMSNYNYDCNSSGAQQDGPYSDVFYLWGQWENNSSNDGIIIRLNIGIEIIQGNSFGGYLPMVLHGTGIKKCIVRFGNSTSYSLVYTANNIPAINTVPFSGSKTAIPSTNNGGFEVPSTKPYIQIDAYLKCLKLCKLEIVM